MNATIQNLNMWQFIAIIFGFSALGSLIGNQIAWMLRNWQEKRTILKAMRQAADLRKYESPEHPGGSYSVKEWQRDRQKEAWHDPDGL